MEMIFKNKLIEHFNLILIRRKLKNDLVEVLSKENCTILREIGLPNGILDFNFLIDINFFSNTEIIIGKTFGNQNIILNLESGSILRDDHCFLAKTLKNFVLQLYVYDYLWKEIIPQSKFGPYRENHNHKKYASFLENELLEIDPELFKNDNLYFWGSYIEDIEFGIVG